MIKTKIIQTLLMVAVVLGLFISCGNILEVKEPVAPKNNDNTKAWVSLGVSHANRTAFPEYDLDAIDLSYTLTGKLNQGEGKVIKTWTSEEETSAYSKMKADTEVLVDAGEWDFTLIVKKGESEILQGSQSKTIQAGQNSLKFTLEAAETGTGSLNYTLNITQSGVQKVKASLLTLEMKSVESVEPVPLDVTDSKATYELDTVKAGTYFVQMEAYTDSEATKLMQTWLEVVYIAPGATTTGEGTLDYTLVTVTFDNKDGVGEISSQTVESGQTATPPPTNPTKAGYVFVGWYSDEEFTNKYDFTTPVTSSFTLYAQLVEGTEITSDTVVSVIAGLSGEGPHNLVATGNLSLSTLVSELKDESKKVNLDLSGVERLETIGYNVFSGCSGLTSITIPAFVKTIGEYAFNECSELTTVTFAAGSQLETIGNTAFFECSSLTSITIPASVKTIGVGAFYGCSELTTVTMEATTPPELGISAFDGTADNLQILVPSSSVDDYKAADGWSYYVDKIKTEITPTTVSEVINNLPGEGPYVLVATGEWTDGLSTLAEALKDESKKINLDLSGVEKLTTIGESAFSGCSSLTSINIPASVTTIGEQAFQGCEKLAEVTFGEGSQLTTIWHSAFKGCSSLQSITIPASVIDIGQQSFQDCEKLAEVTFGGGSQLTTIWNSAFNGCSSLKSITIPASVKIIGMHSFDRCSSLATVTMEADNPPALALNAFPPAVTSILVPSGSVENYKNVTDVGWASYKGKIQPKD